MQGAGTLESPYRSLLRNRSFMALWLGQAVSFLGDYFYFLAIPIMVNKLTGSTLMVGISTISTALPVLLLGPLAGVFVDRWNRKTTMIVSDVLRGLLVLLCLLVHSPEQVWVYYLAGFLMSCVSRFFFPAQSAALPLVVTNSRDLLPANGLMQAVMTVGMLAGPALAGFTIGLWGAWVAFVFDSLSFFVSAVFILAAAIPHTQKLRGAEMGQAGPVLKELKDGLGFLFSNRVLMPMMAGMMTANLCTGAIQVIWVPYLQRTFGVGPEGLGIVDSAQGAGMLVGGLLLGAWAVRLKKIPLAAACLTLIGLFFIGMGLAPVFGVIVVMSVGIGLATVPAGSIVMTILQMVVPDEKRGRVSSAINAMATAAGLTAMGSASFFGEAIGLRNVYLVCGLFNVAAAVLTLFIGVEPEAAPVAAQGTGL